MSVLVVFLLMMTLIVLAWIHRNTPLGFLCAGSSTYLVSVIAARQILDQLVVLGDTRNLLPIRVAVLLSLVTYVARIPVPTSRGWALSLLGLISTIGIAVNPPNMHPVPAHWQTADAYLQSFDMSPRQVLSDVPEEVYLATGHATIDLPREREFTTGATRDAPQELTDLLVELVARQARVTIVLSHNFFTRESTIDIIGNLIDRRCVIIIESLPDDPYEIYTVDLESCQV